jgi:DNA mismatch repair protein MutL
MSVSGPVRSPIRRLDPGTVERIAAGEVVERPASVVKELVENAIDAGARSVTVRLRGGGLEGIEVADDGWGIPPEELELAVERHATSKLPPEGPIDAIGTLGFRGEALASIGSVARLRILSRPVDRDLGEGISIVGGSPVGRFRAARAPGTTVEVADLFFRTPARRKFLKGPAAEQLEIVRTIERLYLARPSVALRVESEGREIASYAPTVRRKDAAAAVLGPAFLGSSFEVVGPVPGGHLFAELGQPALGAPTSTGLYLAVNGRTIVSRPLAQAVRAAYTDRLPRTRYPVGLLHLELEPGRVDANVHPTKREVRFANERELFDAVRRRVREALLAASRDGIAVAPAPARPAGPPRPEAGPRALSSAAAAPRATQRTFSLEGVPAAGAPGLPEATPGGGPRLLGVLDDLYWVAATDDGIVLIDQHAASERLLYDALRRDGALGRQSLVEPVTLSVTGAQRIAFESDRDAVATAGFDAEPFGPGSLRVRAVPAYRGLRARPEALRGLLDELAEGERPTARADLEDRRSATIACHAAIRAGDAVEAATIVQLLRELDRRPDRPTTCPHGRPIEVRLPRGRIDQWFLRRGA